MKPRKKTFSRVVATLATTVMLGTMMVMPAFAEGNQFEGETIEGKYVVKMTKNLTMDDDLYQPTETFEFTVNPYIHDTEELHEIIEGIPVSDGVVNAVSVGDASFTTGGTRQTSANIEISVDPQAFAGHGAGIYKYALSEEAGSNENITYDNTQKYLYVYVENGSSGLEIAGVVVKDKAESTTTGGDKSSSFTNTYGNVGDEDVLHDLMLTKIISGDFANMGQEFDFSIKISNDSADAQVFKYWNDADKDGVEDSGETGTITANAAVETPFVLGNGETVVIYGLRNGDVYNISETDVEDGTTADGYTVKVDGKNDTDGVTEGTLSSADEDINVTYDNYRGAVSPTGVAMTIAPYAIMVVAAAGVAFLFLRRRNSEF